MRALRQQPAMPARTALRASIPAASQAWGDPLAEPLSTTDYLNGSRPGLRLAPTHCAITPAAYASSPVSFRLSRAKHCIISGIFRSLHSRSDGLAPEPVDEPPTRTRRGPMLAAGTSPHWLRCRAAVQLARGDGVSRLDWPHS